MTAAVGSKGFEDAQWDRKEHDWTGKSFFFVTVPHILGKPIGLGKKLEDLNRQMRQAGYKPVNNLVWIQHGAGKGKAMVEVLKQDKYDANVLTFDTSTTAISLIYKGHPSGLAKGVRQLAELVVLRKSMEPREVYYLYVPYPDPANYKTILVGLI